MKNSRSEEDDGTVRKKKRKVSKEGGRDGRGERNRQHMRTYIRTVQ